MRGLSNVASSHSELRGKWRRKRGREWKEKSSPPGKVRRNGESPSFACTGQEREDTDSSPRLISCYAEKNHDNILQQIVIIRKATRLSYSLRITCFCHDATFNAMQRGEGGGWGERGVFCVSDNCVTDFMLSQPMTKPTK